MILEKIGYDPFLKKEVKKIRHETLPEVKLFSSSDVSIGNPCSNVAVAFIYTWKEDRPPAEIREAFQKASNYAALTGYWRTTNGAKYAFNNILANPNINKLIVLVFGAEDNGHMLVDALTKFWAWGVTKEGLIRGAKAANPRFEGVPDKALRRIREQADLVVLKKIKDLSKADRLVKASIQEPENAASIDDLGAEFYSKTVKNGKLYDDGCRFNAPLSTNSKARRVTAYQMRESPKGVGGSLRSESLKDAFEDAVSFISEHGSEVLDQRGILTKECRSLTIVMSDPLKELPEGFSKDYLERYAEDFMKGVSSEGFSYTYHSRIFEKWGDQLGKALRSLRNDPNTRRAIISLWDPSSDISDSSPPCLNFIWAAVREGSLEIHALYRSHHIATVTRGGEILAGDGAFVPNIYALAALQSKMCEDLSLKRGSLAVTDFSSHLYISLK